MRISAKAEYACAAMLELAASYGQPNPVRIKAIAQAQKIPSRFLVQILGQLKTAGLVASVRGAAGGYQLAQAPETITLGHIINAIEKRTPEPPALTKASQTPVVEVLLGVWQDIQIQEQTLLGRLTLAELLRRTQSLTPLTYQI